jgi:hypothetical protein
MRPLLVVFLTFSGVAHGEGFSFEKARASVAFVATQHRFEDGATGFITCAAAILDEKRLVAPLQCVRPNEPIACRAAVAVPSDAQALAAESRRWLAEGARCAIAQSLPALDLVVLASEQRLPKEARPVELENKPPAIGADVFAIGFPDQIPAFLYRATVSALLSRIQIDGVPPDFRARLIGAAGAGLGSEGSPLFDAAGRVVGIVIAHAKQIDGGFAVTAAEIAAAIKR